MKVDLVNYSNIFGLPKNDNPFFANLLYFMKDYWSDSNDNTLENIYMYLQQNKNSDLGNLLTITLKIIDTKDITRMFLSYPSFYSFEASLPYAQITKEGVDSLNFVAKDIKLDKGDNKQLSQDYNNAEWGDTLLNNEWKELQYQVIKQSYTAYNMAIQNRITQAQAESVLPMGLSESQIYVQGTLKEWARFINNNRSSVLNFEQSIILQECYLKIKEVAPFIDFLT